MSLTLWSHTGAPIPRGNPAVSLISVSWENPVKIKVRPLRFIALFFLLVSVMASAEEPSNDSDRGGEVTLEVYATAHQVTNYCGTPDGREKVIQVLNEIGASKIYLEYYRGGHRVDETVLKETRDRLKKAGFQVATGITTNPGKGSGVASNGSKYFFNYEAAETRALLEELFGTMARLFDEILIDDFFLTDDTSEVSAAARGDRSWSEYRLELMTEVAKECVIEPARKTNPKVSIAIKFPQWYDCFHLYGYNVETAPRLFDSIWVGTETRNPDTQRFGFAQPTMGYDNYRWLSSVGGEKVRGAWFDALDCHEDVYLMQAYQSVLASARHLTLFNLGEYMSGNPVLSKFKERREAILQLSRIVQDLQPLGVGAYKPPNRPPGRDLYLFDFLSVLGLPIVPVGRIEDLERFPSVILTGHAKDAPHLLKHLLSTKEAGIRRFLWTPSYAPEHTLNEIVHTQDLILDGTLLKTDREMRFIHVHPPEENEVLVATAGSEEETPVLMRDRLASGLEGWFLNVFTYSYADFEQVDEMFLPPSRLAIPHWPRALADRVRDEVLKGFPLKVSADPPFGLNLYEEGVAVLCNFGGDVKEVILEPLPPVTSLGLHPGFDWAEGVYLEKLENSVYRLRLPGWEIGVLHLQGAHL